MKGKNRAAAGGTHPAGVDWKEVERFLEFMSEHGLDEFEYARGDLRIRLKRSVANSNSAVARRAAEIVVANPGPAEATAPAPAGREAAAEPGFAEDLHHV